MIDRMNYIYIHITINVFKRIYILKLTYTRPINTVLIHVHAHMQYTIVRTYYILTLTRSPTSTNQKPH